MLWMTEGSKVDPTVGTLLADCPKPATIQGRSWKWGSVSLLLCANTGCEVLLQWYNEGGVTHQQILPVTLSIVTVTGLPIDLLFTGGLKIITTADIVGTVQASILAMN